MGASVDELNSSQTSEASVFDPFGGSWIVYHFNCRNAHAVHSEFTAADAELPTDLLNWLN